MLGLRRRSPRIDPARRPLRQAVLVALAVAALFAGCESSESKVRSALLWARLAPLPPSARQTKAETIGNMFSRSIWVRFEADAADIHRFLATSPGLRQATETSLGTQTVTEKQGVDRFPWFDRAKVERGRRWEIPQDQEANYGIVVIDEKRDVVYIVASHS